MHAFHFFHNDNAASSLGKASTISGIYYGGRLKLYIHHIVGSSEQPPTRRHEIIMKQLGAYAITNDAANFRKGATAFRNARDWAKEESESAIVRETAYRGPVGMMRKARWMLRRKVQSTLGSYYVYILAS